MTQPTGSQRQDEDVSPRTVLELIIGKWKTQAVCVAAELGIADLLKDGPRSAQEIAQAVDASEDALYRLLRALASLGLFSSLPERRFALTPVGTYLRSDVPVLFGASLALRATRRPGAPGVISPTVSEPDDQRSTTPSAWVFLTTWRNTRTWPQLSMTR